MSTLTIVVDAQNDFVTGVLGTEEAEIAAQNIAKELEKGKDILVFTADRHMEKEYEETEESKYVPKHCIIGTEGADIVPAISKFSKDRLIFSKNTFACPALVYYIRLLGDLGDIDKIKIMGLCTDVCVISNALLLRSYFPYTPIHVISSCCAGTTPKAHEQALNIMLNCGIYIEA